MRDDALQRAIDLVGVNELARRIGVSSQAISQWRRCPPGRVVAVEQATGGTIRRQELRPELYAESAAA